MNIFKNSFIRNLAVSTVLFSGCIENKVPDIDPCHVDDCRETVVDAGITEIADATTRLIDYSFNDYQANTVDAITEPDANVSDMELDFEMVDIDAQAPDMELDFEMVDVDVDAQAPDMELDFEMVDVDAQAPDMELDFEMVDVDAQAPDMELDFSVELDSEVVEPEDEVCRVEIEAYPNGFVPIYDNMLRNAFSSSSFFRQTAVEVIVPEDCNHQEVEGIRLNCDGFNSKFSSSILYSEDDNFIDLNIFPEFTGINFEIEAGNSERFELQINPITYGPEFMVDPSACELRLEEISIRDSLTGLRQVFELENVVATVQNQPSYITTSLSRINGDLAGGRNELVSGDFRLQAGSLNTDENGAALDGHIQSMEFEIRVEDTQIQEFRLEINQDIVIGNVSMDNQTVNFDLSGLNISVTEDNFAIFDLSITALNVNQSSFVSANLSNIRFISSAHNEDIVYESTTQEREFYRRNRSVLTGQN